jgi:polyferredoxin
MWYFSPAIIIMAMTQHVLNGSFFVFLSMLILAMFLGRSFCGYLCPAGGLQECSASINGKPAVQGKRKSIKYVIWTVWIAAVVISFILGRGTVSVDFFFMTDHGVSVTEIYNYIVYYAVILPILKTVVALADRNNPASSGNEKRIECFVEGLIDGR